MKFLIAGLGNVGGEYEFTRHNIGFSVLEWMAMEAGVSFSLGRHAHVCELKLRGRTLVLIKPTTYMNLSGKAVQYWLQCEKIDRKNLLVITDDLSLPLGKLRLRGSGSPGGHNGLGHISDTFQSDEYTRLRFGIGSDFPKGMQVQFVLSRWLKEEEPLVAETIKKAAEAVRCFATEGLANAMNKYNNK